MYRSFVSKKMNDFHIDQTWIEAYNFFCVVLQKMYLSKEEIKDYHKKLKDYIYVDELQELTLGSYVRWFDLHQEDMDKVELKKGGFVCDFVKGEDDINIVIKTRFSSFFSFPMNKCIIFKKLSLQEKILVKIIDHINK